MNWWQKFLNKYIVVKEIWSQEGELHFRRYRLLSTPWFNIYIHHILKSDEDAHPHDHPWHFVSIILWGGYIERWLGAYENYRYWMGVPLREDVRGIGNLIIHNAKDFHQITLRKKSAWTLVFTSSRERPSWGYQTSEGWMDFKKYRQLKRAGQLPK